MNMPFNTAKIDPAKLEKVSNMIKLEKIIELGKKTPLNTVKLEEKVDHKTLETALVKAAEEIGWKTEVNYLDKTTQIKLKGRILPAMWVLFRYKIPEDIFKYVEEMSKPREERFYDIFYTIKMFPIGFASKKKFKQYLSAVYRNLQD